MIKSLFGILNATFLPSLTLFVSAVLHCCNSKALASSSLDVALCRRAAMKVTTEAQAVEAIKELMIPYDPRFPNQNQTRNCWQNYVDYHRCVNLRGEDYAACNWFKKNFGAICPNSWVEKWDDQRERGVFPAKL